MRVWLLALWSVAASCHLIGGADDLQLIDDASSSGGAPSTTTTTTEPSTGGEGGVREECSDALCQMEQGECETCACLDGVVCDCDPIAVGQACSLGWCDGGGQCVECLDNVDHGCLVNESCDVATYTCIAANCTDGIQNGSETDINCGGPDCNKCLNGDSCENASDCQSNLCSGLLCTPCTNSGDCSMTQYCSGATCFNKGNTFDSCAGDEQCLSGNCCCIFTVCGCC